MDLDGTLLNTRGEVSERNRHAIADARAAGLRVVPCTGRGLAECAHVLRRIDQLDPVVVAGGAIIACPTSGGTLHRFALSAELVERAVGTVLEHEHVALVLKDPVETGFDYLVVRGAARYRLDPVTEWWFRSMNVRVHTVNHIREDPHPQHTVRVGACGMSGVMARVRDSLVANAGEGTHVHHFPAVVAPEHARVDERGQTLHVLELFSADANKWSAVSHVARGWGVGREEVVAIGDEINDVPMVRGAGLGVAMGNAVAGVRTVAGKSTLSNDEDGVAHAVGRVLAGEW